MLNENPQAAIFPAAKPFTGALTLLAALALVAALHPVLSRAGSYQPAFILSDMEREEVNTSAFAMILGEVRASAADLMWIKTERYLHRGVAYKPHIDAEAVAHTGEVVTQAASENHDHEEESHEGEKLVALVPEAANDYRGFIGTLHRAVQPWKGPDEPDEHTAGDELVPWYRLLTYSDPHHWRGYMIGTWWLSKIKEPQALAEATAFIKEGIRNNPDAFQLHLMNGRLHIQQQRWIEAIQCFEQAVQVGLKIRPAGGQLKPAAWSESDEEDFAASLRYIPSIQFRKLNDLKAAQASLARGLELLPSDGPLKELRAQLDHADIKH